MFPVPRVLKEPSYAEEVMTKCFKNRADKHHLRRIQNAPSQKCFPLTRRPVVEMSDGEDRTILEKIRCRLNLCCEKTISKDPQLRKDTLCTAYSISLSHSALTFCSSVSMPYFYISQANYVNARSFVLFATC